MTYCHADFVSGVEYGSGHRPVMLIIFAARRGAMHF